MTYSPLTNSVITTDKCNGRAGRRICKITPHHMAGIMSGASCATYLQQTSRQASANYCIGVDGDISCNVEEEYRAWTSSSWENDSQAITIEVSDCDGNWNISNASWNALVNLCVDICKRYGFRMTYDGTPNGSLTEHRMFAQTDCPGQYLHNHMGQLADEVNARLQQGIQPSPYAVFRLYNPNTGEHFFTSDVSEANDNANRGWSYEGIAWFHCAPKGIPMYRLYNPYAGFHMFTTNAYEKNDLIAQGWNDEGIAFNVEPSSNKPIYRSYNPFNGQHMWTADYDEHQHVVRCGWQNEGVGFYAD